jgi:hypothetical protein
MAEATRAEAQFPALTLVKKNRERDSQSFWTH